MELINREYKELEVYKLFLSIIKKTYINKNRKYTKKNIRYKIKVQKVTYKNKTLLKIGNTPKEDKIDTLKTKTKINVKKTGPILNKSQM